MKLSAVIKKLGLLLCLLGGIGSIFVFWQMIEFTSSPDSAGPGVLWYANLACVFILPIAGSSLIKWSVLLMLQCR